MAGLFDAFALGDLVLPSRIVMAPMTRRRAADGKIPTDLNALHYAQRAGAALIFSESIEVDPFSGLLGPTRPGLFSEEQEAGWKLVTEAVHNAGGRIFAQLSHMGRTAHPSQLSPGGRIVGPSAIAAAGSMFTAQGPQPYGCPKLSRWRRLRQSLVNMRKPLGEPSAPGSMASSCTAPMAI